MRLNVIMSALLALLHPCSAQAQTIAISFEELRQMLKTDQSVVVTDTSGEQIKGKVAAVSQSSLVLLIPETRTFVEGSVTEIRGPDTLRRGLLAGLGIGAGAGLAMVAAMCADGPGCGPSAQVVTIAAGIGAAIGAGVDALLKNRGRLLYRSRAASKPSAP